MNYLFHFHLELDKIKRQALLGTLCIPLLLFATPLLADEPMKTAPTLKALNKQMWKNLRKGKILSLSKVETQGKRQSLDYYAAGLHPRSCHKALRKISRYEDYRHFLSFVHKSQYDPLSQEIRLLIKHSLIPFPLTMHLSLPRITSPGLYSFLFLSGMLKGLKGHVQITPQKSNQCLIELKGTWKGATTKLNDTIFEIFVTTLGRLGMRKLFRISII